MRTLQAIIVVLITGLMINCMAGGSIKTEALKGKKFHLKHSIYNIENEITEVHNNNIIYSKKCCKPGSNWGLEYKLTKAAFFGSLVTIKSIKDIGGYMKIILDVEYDETRVPERLRARIKARSSNVPVLLKKDRNGGIARPFRLILTQDMDYEDEKYDSIPYDLDKRKNLIKRLGYPISICRIKDRTIYYYNKSFLGFELGGKHDVWFAMDKKVKVIEIEGFI